MPIILDKVSHIYAKDTAMAVSALENVSLVIPDGQFIGLIGHTGSGKSTLVQHLNGLMKATSGSIYFNGEDVDGQGFDKRVLRSKVGLVFQYPEHQLRAYEALKLVGLEDEYFYQSPFDLSGGQKRRVAIAGVLAMKPQVLILDEPTAGLDPKGRDEILDQISKLKEETKITVILVSHSMDDVAKYVDRIIVMNKGCVMYDDEPKAVFEQYQYLEEIGLSAPQVTYIMKNLRVHGYDVNDKVTTIEEAKEEIKQYFASVRV